MTYYACTSFFPSVFSPTVCHSDCSTSLSFVCWFISLAFLVSRFLSLFLLFFLLWSVCLFFVFTYPSSDFLQFFFYLFFCLCFFVANYFLFIGCDCLSRVSSSFRYSLCFFDLFVLPFRYVFIEIEMEILVNRCKWLPSPILRLFQKMTLPILCVKFFQKVTFYP